MMSEEESDGLEEVVRDKLPVKQDSKRSPLKSLNSSFKSKKNRKGWDEKIRLDSDGLRGEAPENDSDTEVPNIPVLEDMKASSAPSVAHAPQMSINLVTSYEDLNKQLRDNNKFPGIDKDIDLKILTSRLPDEAEFASIPHEVTSWDTLLTEVKSWYMKSQEEGGG